jgi:hypothetical protein
MTIAGLLFTASALCIIPILIKGAISDWNTRTFPKELWNPIFLKCSGAFTILAYGYLFANNMWGTAIAVLAASLITAMVFAFVGIRFGSGGDMRALMWIALVSPILIPMTLLIGAIVSLVLAIYALAKKTTVPLAVAILIGYIGSILWILAMHRFFVIIF